MYAFSVSLILICMIATGAARSVAVKLFYQLGFTSPLFVTLLYLLGQSFSVVVYLISVKVKSYRHRKPSPAVCDIEGHQNYSEFAEDSAEEHSLDEYTEKTLEDEIDVTLVLSDFVQWSTVQDISCTSFENECDGEETEETNIHSLDKSKVDQQTLDVGSVALVQKRRGSETGLSGDSSKAVKWVHSIPWYLKPAIPGFCNLCNSAMRWGSLIYVSASVAEIMISGLELVLSVFAARYIRKRIVSSTRWFGVGIVAFGLVLVGTLHLGGSSGNDSGVTSDKVTGMLLILGQCIMSVMQDIAEELFMSEVAFPATLLLGMEGLFGLAFGVLLYVPLAKSIGEDTSATWNHLTISRVNAGFAIFLPFLFTVTGIFNIMATGATSSMTRNVWKNLRTVLVWVFSLSIYYGFHNSALGEPWFVPDSFYTLCGFGIMLSGIYVYYTTPQPSAPTSSSSELVVRK